jgi:CYTH domain-containing protein
LQGSGDATVQSRIRSRTEVGASASHYNITIRYPNVDGQRVETRRNLQSREYETLLRQSDPRYKPVMKLRRCFLHNDLYFQLDIYQSPQEGLVLLEGYFGIDDPVEQLAPDWMQLEEVTNQSKFSMAELSKI